jgi:hypothetical protein
VSRSTGGTGERFRVPSKIGLVSSCGFIRRDRRWDGLSQGEDAICLLNMQVERREALRAGGRGDAREGMRREIERFTVGPSGLVALNMGKMGLRPSLFTFGPLGLGRGCHVA